MAAARRRGTSQANWAAAVPLGVLRRAATQACCSGPSSLQLLELRELLLLLLGEALRPGLLGRSLRLPLVGHGRCNLLRGLVAAHAEDGRLAQLLVGFRCAALAAPPEGGHEAKVSGKQLAPWGARRRGLARRRLSA
eukprot:scaffold2727_cov385-Prasinococcus_capsulatus_cf.AAC.8